MGPNIKKAWEHSCECGQPIRFEHYKAEPSGIECIDVSHKDTHVARMNLAWDDDPWWLAEWLLGAIDGAFDAGYYREYKGCELLWENPTK
jgi:hypothetical protein